MSELDARLSTILPIQQANLRRVGEAPVFTGRHLASQDNVCYCFGLPLGTLLLEKGPPVSFLAFWIRREVQAARAGESSRITYEEPMRIQLCPALMDWIVFLVLFAVQYGAGERGLTGSQSAWLAAITMITYMPTSLLIGMILTRRNARILLLVSTVLTTALGALCLLLEQFPVQMTCLGLLGVGLGVFFNSFQTFMRGETAPGGLARAVGYYTLAWSGGSSLGFLSSGVVYRMGMYALSGVDVAVGLAVLWILLRHRHRHHEESSADEHIEAPAHGSPGVHSAYVLIGWCMIFTATFVQRPLQSLFPTMCARAEIAPLAVGSVLFVHMLLQGVWGYAIHRFAKWRYRRTPIVLLHLAAAMLFALMAWQPSFHITSMGIIVLALYMGFAYYSAVYYSSNAGRRSLNIGINECLVGVGCVSGLFVAQRWTEVTGNEASMYVVGAVALVASMLVQLAIASRPTTSIDATAAEPASVSQ